jgi:hypothetical protein
MTIKLQPAVKILKPLKVLSYGPTYSGKTLSSLYLALGVVMSLRKCKEEEAYKHIVMIDTEYGRGALYSKLGPYNYLQITPPYDTNKLNDLIHELNEIDNIDVIIIDSLTHFWVKEGGILDQKATKDKQGGNTYTNWLDFTAKFNKMLDVILSSPKHIFVTARAKTDTALIQNDKGKATPVTYGLKPELREGIDFDFDIVFNIDKISHNLIVDKGVPGTQLIYDMATPDLGKQLYDLFTADSVIGVRTEEQIRIHIRNIALQNNLITFVQLELSGRKLDDLLIDDLNKLETKLLQEIKKGQKKK